MNVKKYLKKGISFVILFFIMLIVFCVAMLIAYALPNDRIQAHIAESEEVLTTAVGTPFYSTYIKGGQLDEYTDLIIMNTAMNKGKSEDESLIVRAFENSRYSEDDMNQYELMQATIENEDLYNNQPYARYWHGIQTIVRPLLLFFNYEEIRFLLMIVMFMLLAGASILIYKNLSIWHALSFVFSMIVINFFIIPMSLQYVGVFAIMLIGVILVNVLYQKKKEKWLPYLFFIIGGCTPFLDLLTAPMITLGMPLLVVILLRIKEKCTIKKIVIELIKLSILWAISYAAIFASKWIIASIVLNQDIVTEAIMQIFFRTGGSEEYPATKLGAMWENIKYLYNTVLLLIGIIIAVVWVIIFVKKLKNKEIKNIKSLKMIIPLIIIAIYPYLWYAVVAGHSTIHAFFTYRIQAITIFAGLCAMIECVNIKEVKKLNPKKTSS